MNAVKTIVMSGSIFVGLLLVACNKEHFTSRDTSGLKPTPPPPPPVVDTTLTVFDAADKLTDWEIVGGGSEEKVGKKEGEAYLKSAITVGNDYMHFIKRRPTPVDPKLTVDNGQFYFWYYVSDVADLKLDGQIELTSSGQSDVHEYAWNLVDFIPTLKVGWNEMKCNFSAAQLSGDGGPDIHAFNFFRIYFWTNDKTSHPDVTVGVDDLKFMVRKKINVSFNTCDSLDNWETAGNVGSIDKVSKKEGAGSLKAPIADGGDFQQFIFKRPAAVNPGLTMANGQLHFWFFVSDPTQLKVDGQIELTSSGKSDDHEIDWNLGDLIPNLHAGWNEMKLNFSDAGLTGDGGADLTALNYFKVYLWTSSKSHPDVVLALDDLRLTEK